MPLNPNSKHVSKGIFELKNRYVVFTVLENSGPDHQQNFIIRNTTYNLLSVKKNSFTGILFFLLYNLPSELQNDCNYTTRVSKYSTTYFFYKTTKKCFYFFLFQLNEHYNNYKRPPDPTKPFLAAFSLRSTTSP